MSNHQCVLPKTITLTVSPAKIFLSCWCCLNLVYICGCAGSGTGSNNDNRKNSQTPRGQILSRDDESQILETAQRIIEAWEQADNDKLAEYVFFPSGKPSINLGSGKYISRRAMESPVPIDIALSYDLAKVQFGRIQSNAVIAVLIRVKDTWRFLHFTTEPAIEFEAFGVETDDDTRMDLIHATDMAAKNFDESGKRKPTPVRAGIPFFATAFQLDQPDKEYSPNSMSWMGEAVSTIRTRKMVFAEIANGDNLHEGVYLVFQQFENTFRCIDGIKSWRTAINPVKTELLDPDDKSLKEPLAKVIRGLFLDADLEQILEQAKEFSPDEIEVLIPFAKESYRYRQSVFKDKTRLPVARYFGARGDSGNEMLPELIEEFPSFKQPYHSEDFLASIGSAIQNMEKNSSWTSQLIRRAKTVEDWMEIKALVKLLDTKKIVNKDDSKQLIKLFTENDAQMRSRLNELAEGKRQRTADEILRFLKLFPDKK